MNDKDWAAVMFLYVTTWPNQAHLVTPGTSAAWRRSYGHHPRHIVERAFDALAATPSDDDRAPMPPRVHAAIAEQQRPRPPEDDQPELPVGGGEAVAARNARDARRARVIRKLWFGAGLVPALNRDGSPTPGFEDDPDLWDDVADPLIPLLRQAHIEGRAAAVAAAQLTGEDRTDAELAADPAYADEIAAALDDDDPRNPDTPAVRAARRERGRRRAIQIRATMNLRAPGSAERVERRVAQTASLVGQMEPATPPQPGLRSLTHCGDPDCPNCTPPRPPRPAAA